MVKVINKESKVSKVKSEQGSIVRISKKKVKDFMYQSIEMVKVIDYKQMIEERQKEILTEKDPKKITKIKRLINMIEKKIMKYRKLKDLSKTQLIDRFVGFTDAIIELYKQIAISVTKKYSHENIYTRKNS
jgi:hypothetical protein